MVFLYVYNIILPNAQDIKIGKFQVDIPMREQNSAWLSKFKNNDFFYPVQQVRLQFNSFNSSNISSINYNIYSLKFNINKYDFECLKFVFTGKNLMYSFVKDSTNVKFNLIIDNLMNKNAIKMSAQKCLIK